MAAPAAPRASCQTIADAVVIAALESLSDYRLTAESRQLMESVIVHAPRGCTAQELARYLAVPMPSLNSRCARAGVPSPYALLTGMRLAVVAALIAQGHRCWEAAEFCGLSTSQNLARHCRAHRGCTARAMGPVANQEFDRFLELVARHQTVAHPLTGTRHTVAA